MVRHRCDRTYRCFVEMLSIKAAFASRSATVITRIECAGVAPLMIERWKKVPIFTCRRELNAISRGQYALLFAKCSTNMSFDLAQFEGKTGFSRASQFFRRNHGSPNFFYLISARLRIFQNYICGSYHAQKFSLLTSLIWHYRELV